MDAICIPENRRTRPVKKEFWFYIENVYVLSTDGARDERAKEIILLFSIKSIVLRVSCD